MSRRRVGLKPLKLVALCGASAMAQAADLQALWDFRQPALSEQRFRDALATAQGDEALILRTQIARSFGLRGDFEAARRELTALAPALPTAGAEARVRWALEWGRTWASAKHPEAARTAETDARARQAFQDALDQARQHALDGLAIDAIHMMAFVDTAPADQRRWAEAALAVALASPQPQARRWEASIRHNLGFALHQLGQYPQALDEFQRALALRQQQGDAAQTGVARWMVAWTLRSLGRLDEALQMQSRLASDNAAAGTPDPYVFDELAELHRAQGREAEARAAAAQAAALRAVR